MASDFEAKDGRTTQAEALRTGVNAIRRKFLEAHGATETTSEILIKEGGRTEHYFQNPDGWKMRLQTSSDIRDPNAVFAYAGSFVGVSYASIRNFQDSEPIRGLDAVSRIRDSFFGQNTELGPDDSARAESEDPRPVIDSELGGY